MAALIATTMYYRQVLNNFTFGHLLLKGQIIIYHLLFKTA